MSAVFSFQRQVLGNVGIQVEAIAQNMRSAAAACTLQMGAVKKSPRISSRTLETIASRNGARCNNQYELERAWNNTIKNLVNADRKEWLESQLESADWAALRCLEEGTLHSQGRLQDLNGTLIESGRRADTFAEYYERVQWGGVADVQA